MAKGKSSATSGTRKKHARKAAAAHGDPQEPQVPKEKKPKGKEKGKKNKEPRKKVYIPPVKPAPVQPDPLDTLGIAQRIPAELLIVLRLLAKKDSITKRRALEDLQAVWVEKARRETDEIVLLHLQEILPVWLHHVPVLFLHPSRRIRLLAVGLHASFLQLPDPIPEQLIFTLHEVLDADNAEYVVGAWCMAAHDIDRQVSAYARESWDRFVAVSAPKQDSEDEVNTLDAQRSKLHLSVGSDAFTRLWDFAQRAILDPVGVYTYVNPPQPMALSPRGKQGGKGASARSGREDDPPSRSGREDEEESEPDRKARLRIGGFGVAEWVLSAYTRIIEDQKKIEDFIAPLENVALWASLYYGQFSPFVSDEFESFGYNQPVVRRTAWSFLQSLLRLCKDHLQLILPTMSVAILRSAWVEPDPGVRSIMWQPLLTFLRAHPNAWDLEAVSQETEDDNSEDEDAVEEPETPKINPSESKPLSSSAYQEFGQFLALGCMGSPTQGYPAIIVILSTIPPSILASVASPVQTLFTSFWAAVDGRALSGLDRSAASAAFLDSLLECILFVVGRLLGNYGSILTGAEAHGNPRDDAIDLLKEQIKRVWEELCDQRVKVDDAIASASLSKFLTDLNRNDSELFGVTWESLVSVIRVQINSSASPVPRLLPIVIHSFNKSFSGGTRPHTAAKELASEVVQTTISQFEQFLQADESVSMDQERLDSLVVVLSTFGEDLFTNLELASAIDNTCLHNASRILHICPAVLLVYSKHRNDEERCLLLWSAVLKGIVQRQDEMSKYLTPLLDAAEHGELAGFIRPSEGEMDDTVGQLMVFALNGRHSDSLALVRRLLVVPDYFITHVCQQALLSSLCAMFAEHVRDILRGEEITTVALDGLLSLLEDSLNRQVLSTEQQVSLLPHIFTFAYLLPLTSTSAKSLLQFEKAQSLWRTGLSQTTDEVRGDITVHVKQTLRDIITDCSITLSMTRLMALISDASFGITVNIIEELLPDRTKVDDMLNTLPTSPSEPCLAVIDPLVLPGDWSETEEWTEPEYDQLGYTVYSRVVSAFLACFRNDWQTAKENIWALRHCIALATWANDLLQVRSSQSPVFSIRTNVTDLHNIVSSTRALCAFLFAHTSQDTWLRPVIDGLLQGRPRNSTDGIEQLLHALVSPKVDCIRDSRILYAVLEHVLADASKTDADLFIRLARSLQRKAPHASLATILAVTKYAPEPPTLERYRNELAADIFGVSPSKANTDGLWMLRRLVATAPDPESDVVYLPTPRAVNLMKACQQWITSDEDLDEEVECEMTSIFRHLAPILQNVPGSHWDLIFDLMESNLENSAFDELSSLPILARTLELLLAVQDLVTTNKALRASWDERKTSILTLVRDLTAKKLDSVTGNVPLSECRELALTVVQDLPESLLDKETLSKMCHILTDPSDTVQRMAYKMLHESAAKYTEYLVLEAGVDSDAEIKMDLPLELVSLLQMSMPDSDFEVSETVFGYLLGWMLTFDLFANASLKVRSGYVDHMRRLDLIKDYFLPRIFGILRLYDGLPKAVKLDIWAVDEYYLDLYSNDSSISIPLLAAHLYFRSLRLVPSLIRSWLVDCRDRQLSTTVTTYTSTHFSPALLQAELQQVKTPDATAELTDENMKVKVANAVNEITASYTVDEYELEIRLKLPSDWPLHTIEIRDAKRVGVNEDRWRAWILGVQQILTFRSGSIVDGLAFFKKNVSSHFEGQSECAICYSMISAMDGTLPKKPCRTCKNRFHAGCLYKWFNTSHSSSCPLCRSEIIQ